MKNRISNIALTILSAAAFCGAALLLLSACYAPEARIDGGLEFDIRMAAGDSGNTRVLAGLVVDAGFEEVLKNVTQLLAILDLDFDAVPLLEDQIDDKATEYLLDLAFDGTISFGGNPFFAVEVPYDNTDPTDPTADFSIYGIPSNRDYFLYMGGFQDTDEVKQYFGLKDEDADFDGDLVPYSNLFYMSGTDAATITVPFTVPGITIPGFTGFDITTAEKYNGPGWYYLTDWVSTATTSSATIIAPARQPFGVATGKTTSIEVHLVQE